MRHFSVSVISVVVAAVLVGCTPAAVPTPAAPADAVPTAAPEASTPAPSLSPAPSASTAPAVPSDPAPVSEPVRFFGGECSRALAEAQLDALLDEGWRPYDDFLQEQVPDVKARTSFAPEGTLGGISCRWKAPESSSSGLWDLEVLVLPAAEVPTSFRTQFSTQKCGWNYDALICRLAAVRGDAWILASTMADGSEDRDPDHAAALGRAISAVSDAVENNPTSPKPASRTGEWWETPSCTVLGEGMRIDDLTSGTFRAGYWEGSPQPEQILLDQAGVQRNCPWFSDSETIDPGETFRIFTVTAAPGAHWAWESVTAGASEVEVAGAMEARTFSRPADEGGDLYVTDGANILVVGGEDTEFLVEIAERALAVLDETT